MIGPERSFSYWSYRGGESGIITGQTAICALRKVFAGCEVIWSHGSPVYDQGIYVVTDVENQKQFSATIREV